MQLCIGHLPDAGFQNQVSSEKTGKSDGCNGGNLRTGKKFAQGPKDLRQFKEHYSQIAQRYKLPVLKGYEPEDDTTCDEWDNRADYQVMQPIEDVFISEPVNSVVPMEKQAQVVPQLMTRFCLDFERYYQLGFGKGRL